MNFEKFLRTPFFIEKRFFPVASFVNMKVKETLQNFPTSYVNKKKESKCITSMAYKVQG